MRRFTFCSTILLVASLLSIQIADGESPKESALSKSDREYLDSLFREFLFDPTGAERVRIEVVDRSRWSGSEKKKCDVWLVKGKKGEPDRVYFTDGYSIPAPPADKIEHVDFLAPIKKFFNARQPPEEETGPWVEKTAREILGDSESYLTLAAWLYRLGHEELSRKMLGVAMALDKSDPRIALRSSIAMGSFDQLHEVFCNAHDDEATARCTHYLKVFPKDNQVKTSHAQAMLVDLERRFKSGNQNKRQSRSLPSGFPSWSPRKKLDHLITSLDLIGRQEPEFGRVHSMSRYAFPFLDDVVVNSLIELGELAVPALLDVIERDTRLTRYPECSGKFSIATGRILSVKEAAVVAVMSILRTKEFPPIEGDERIDELSSLIKRIRQYWIRFGARSYSERMMSFLKDDSLAKEDWRAAAKNLVRWDYSLLYTPFGSWTEGRPPEFRMANPYVRSFQKPTVAEAILAAMDRDWAVQQTNGVKRFGFESWVEIEKLYFDLLVELGDKRIGVELNRRALTTRLTDLRCKYAFAANKLGVTSEWIRFSREIERGMAQWISDTKKGEIESPLPDRELLATVVRKLIDSDTRDSERALASLADSRHSYFPIVADAILSSNGPWPDRPWCDHPICFTFLSRGLDDMTKTDGRWNIDDDRIRGGGNGWGCGSSIPDQLKDPNSRRMSAEERVCDRIAFHLTEVTVGLPYYHVLLREPDAAIARLKRALERHKARFRPLTNTERRQFHGFYFVSAFIPNIQPLAYPATAADVTKGLAVFELNGKGSVVDRKLPAWLLLKSEAKKENPAFGLVVQAEIDADGKVVYGVIFRHDIRAVTADEVERIERYERR